jgi:hypothetical protein
MEGWDVSLANMYQLRSSLMLNPGGILEHQRVLVTAPLRYWGWTPAFEIDDRSPMGKLQVVPALYLLSFPLSHDGGKDTHLGPKHSNISPHLDSYLQRVD